MAEDLISGAVDQRGVRLAERQWTVGFPMIRERCVELCSRQTIVFRDPIQMNATEDQVVGSVSRDQILNITAVGAVEIEISFPRRAAVAPDRFQKRYQTLVGQMAHLRSRLWK